MHISELKIENMSEAKTEITRLINLYIDGAGKGDASKLNEAFDS